MSKSRLEAFSDGVIAIILTIMVLEMKVPHDASWAALSDLYPVFISYVMSFVYIAIYWNNHHHMLHLADRVNGAILWANLNLLFWLSLFPFCTGWIGQNHFASAPTMVYGVVLLMAANSYTLLQATIIRAQGATSPLRAAIGADKKGKASLALYALAIGLTLVSPWIGIGIYAVVALMWLVPDRRIESRIR